jgi:hypothetical protein
MCFEWVWRSRRRCGNLFYPCMISLRNWLVGRLLVGGWSVVGYWLVGRSVVGWWLVGRLVVGWLSCLVSMVLRARVVAVRMRKGHVCVGAEIGDVPEAADVWVG